MVKIARPLDGLMVLTMKVLAIHFHLFVFGQESGYWWTCLCENICFAEVALFDLRIIWDGCEEEGVKKEYLWRMQSFARVRGCFGVNM